MKYDKYTNLIIAISLNHFYNIMPRTSISGYNRNLNTSFNDWVKRTSIYLNEPIPEYFKTILDDNEDCINLGYYFITLMHLYQKTYNKYYKNNNDLKNAILEKFGTTFSVKVCALETEQMIDEYPVEVKYKLNTKLESQIEADREARIEIAKAEAARQAVTVNTNGK